MPEDILHALRQLRRQPGFAAAVIVTLGLGIGANSAVFSVVDAVLLKALPVKDPRQLVLFEWAFQANRRIAYLTGDWRHDAATNQVRAASFSLPAFERFRDEGTTLGDVMACAHLGHRNVRLEGDPERVHAQAVSGRYFAGLGLGAAAGRTLASEDAEAAVLGYAYWQRRFGGRTDVIGKTGSLDGHPFTVVGVAPRGFGGTMRIGTPPDLFVSLPMLADLRPGSADPNSFSLQVIGRLDPDIPRSRAEAEMSALLSRSLPGTEEYRPQLRLADGHQGSTGRRLGLREPLLMLGAVSGLVLLMACTSVAGLLLVRAGARRHEMSVRLALGAGRWPLVRQLLTESLALSLLGGLAALVVAAWTKDVLAAGIMTGDAPPIALDVRILAFTAAVSAAAGLVFGLVPALRATRGEAELRLPRTHMAPGRALVVAQMGLSFVLLVGTGLLVRTLLKLTAVETGFDGRSVHVFRVQAAEREASDLSLRLMERLRAAPGVAAVGVSDHDLVGGNTDRTPVSIEGVTAPGSATSYGYVNNVGGDFFDATGIPIRAGRALVADDAGRRVMVVNESFTRAHLPGRDALGMKVNGSEVVGVAGDTKYGGLREPAPPTMFIPVAPPPGRSFYVRTDMPSMVAATLIQRTVREVSPTTVPYGFNTPAGQVAKTLGQERFLAGLTALFGALALLLASIGLYGLVAYSVSRRTREIGVRMAMGASASDVVRHTILEGMRLVVAGALLGALGASVLARVLAGMLYGVGITDPPTFVAAAAVLAVSALLACWLPARRAARVDPAVALRYE